jgi:hypothetical protein
MPKKQTVIRVRLEQSLTGVRKLIGVENNPKDLTVLYDALQLLLMYESAKKYDATERHCRQCDTPFKPIDGDDQFCSNACLREKWGV